MSRVNVIVFSHEEDQGFPNDDDEEENEEDSGIQERKKPDTRSALQMMGYTLSTEEYNR